MTTSSEPVAEQPPAAAASEGRMTGLSERMHRLRTNASAGRLDRWLLVVGAVLMPLGIVLIVLGWVGASGTSVVSDQIDYILSGGLLGLGLVVAGGFTYFAYWQTVRVRDARAQSAELGRAMARLETLLTTGGSAAVAEVFVATAAGTLYHRSGCAAVAARVDLREVDVATTELSACRICLPAEPA
jgi:hypothetical protein